MFIDFLVQKLKKALKKAKTSKNQGKCSPKNRENWHLPYDRDSRICSGSDLFKLLTCHIKEQIRILESRKRPNGFVSFSALKTPQK